VLLQGPDLGLQVSVPLGLSMMLGPNYQ